MRLVNQVSLISGPVPWILTAATAAGFLYTVARADRRARWSAIAVVAVTVVVLDAFAAVVDLPRRLHGTYPPSFVLWAALPFVAAWLAASTWRRSGNRHRGVAVATIAVALLFAADQVNGFYGYVPTIGDLRGAPVAGEVATLPAVPVRAVRSTATDGAHAGRGWHAVALTARHVVPATGVVAPLAIPGTVSGFHGRRAWVWLPPAWFEWPHPRLPVIELLAGTPGTPSDWLRGGRAVGTLDQFAAAHHGWAPIVVVADQNGSFTGDTECVDRPGARAETYLTVDVVRTVTARLDAARGPRRWAIAGLSEGGTCAVTLGLRHPALYGAFGDFSGDPMPNLVSRAVDLGELFGGSTMSARMHDPAWLIDHPLGPLPFAWFGIGRSDSLRRIDAMRADAASILRQGGRAVFWETSGGHSFYVTAHCFTRALPTIADALQ